MESDNPNRPSQHLQVETYESNPYAGLNPQDLASLGATMVTNGLNALQARALVAQVQQVAAQAALATANNILEEVRKVQEARMAEILQRLYTLPNMLGHYVRRDLVVQLIQSVASKTPRQ